MARAFNHAIFAFLLSKCDNLPSWGIFLHVFGLLALTNRRWLLFLGWWWCCNGDIENG